MRRLSIVIGLGLVLLAGCGGSYKSITGESGTSTSGSSTSGSGTTATVLSLGSGTGSGFQAGALAISTKALSAGGSTSLQVSLVDQTGALDTTSTTITFSSPCASQGLATITATPAAGSTPASPAVTTTTGTANATYAANGCSGSDVITATALAGTQTLTATGTVTVTQAAIGSISFISATPSAIALKGVGSVGGSATSIVVFKVLDTSGGPRSGATVTMALNSSVGGITLAPATATTGVDGEVQTVVSGGTVATTVRVTATTTTSSGTSISTESNALTVSTGIPTSHNLSLAVGGSSICRNVEAWNLDNVTVPVLVSMTDRFSNPVPDGTTVNFQTTLGGIQASCQTGPPTAVSGSGQCSVNWVSKAPYTVNGNPHSTSGNANVNPAYCSSSAGSALNLCNGTTNGRSPIMATAIGEESFIDANGNGVFDAGDTVAFDAADLDNNFANGSPKPWQDTSEPFLNEWELFDAYSTPTFVAGEPFIDFNSNGTRDGPDGLFNGPLCQGSLCSTTQTSVAIGAGNVIVLSGSTANLSVLSPGGGPPYSYKSGLSLAVEIYDDRLQQMPGGTTVSATLSSGITGTITSPPPAAWPCTTAGPYVDANGNVIAGLQFVFTVSPTSPVPATGLIGGTLYITVTTPLKLATTFAIPLSTT